MKYHFILNSQNFNSGENVIPPSPRTTPPTYLKSCPSVRLKLPIVAPTDTKRSSTVLRTVDVLTVNLTNDVPSSPRCLLPGNLSKIAR